MIFDYGCQFVFPEWWGAVRGKAGVVTDDSDAILEAYNAAKAKGAGRGGTTLK